MIQGCLDCDLVDQQILLFLIPQLGIYDKDL